MKLNRVILLFALLIGAVFAQAFAASAQSEAGDGCALPFKATVRSGASAGTALTGTLAFSLDETGALIGSLKMTDDSEIPVYGQANGRAINLVFDLSTADKPDVLIFGTGTALDPVNGGTCGTILGGSFVGPQEGDSGDWGVKPGPPDSAFTNAQQTGFNVPSTNVQPSGFDN